eukprot:TRINITY_DN13036_c0_g1_i1.p4 TRINITY_DN13036_c0_g1~~TRINITY_DN13036_c0_g1_i1.p4  ORF type:complete len:120 (-),score=2.37 TRINITY_DN13036_c0_g1_i1:90-449(-)
MSFSRTADINLTFQLTLGLVTAQAIIRAGRGLLLKKRRALSSCYLLMAGCGKQGLIQAHQHPVGKTALLMANIAVKIHNLEIGSAQMAVRDRLAVEAFKLRLDVIIYMYRWPAPGRIAP